MAEQSRTEAVGVAAQTWVWDTGIGDSSVYSIAHLTDSTLYIRQSLVTARGRDKILNALQSGDPPDESFKRGTVIPLREVVEFRYAESASVVEIHYRSKSPAVVYDKKGFTPRKIYSALQARLAPNIRPALGKLQGGNSIYTPFIGLFLTLTIGALFTVWAVFADPDPHNTGRRSGLKNAIDVFLAHIGVVGTIGITLGVAAIFGGWMAYRIMNPHQAEVIVIDERGDGAAAVAE